MHETGTAEEWNESYYFNFFDPQENIAGFTRIGFKPNRKEGMGFLFLFFKGKILAYHQKIEISHGFGNLKIGSLEFHPGWTITFSGKMAMDDGRMRDVSLSLEYSEISEALSYLECVTEEESELGRAVGEDHYEQIGIVKGRVRVDSESYAISGFSERDHSWGERDWNAPDLWIYVTAHFSLDFGLNIAKVLINNKEIDAGFIMTKGRIIPVVKILAGSNSDDSTQERHEYTIWDKKGSCYVLAGEVIQRVQIPFTKNDKISILSENFSQFHCEGRRGFGIIEHLVKLR